jgi:hypothetical protein
MIGRRVHAGEHPVLVPETFDQPHEVGALKMRETKTVVLFIDATSV